MFLSFFALFFAFASCSSPYFTSYPGCKNCVLPVGYWKTHHAFSSNDFMKIPWPRSCKQEKSTAEQNMFFNMNVTWLDFMNLPTSYHDSCIPAGKEMIAAVLNRCAGACQDEYIRGNILEAKMILEEICPGGGSYGNQTYQQSIEIGKITNNLIQYNRGSGSLSECKREEDNDCNRNGIVDKCEIKKLKIEDACIATTGDYVVRPEFKWCLMLRAREDQFCRNLKLSNETDCDGNHILDSCQLRGLSDLRCTSDVCIGHSSIERTPVECLRCRSDDKNFNGKPDECDIMDGGLEVGLPVITDCNENGIDDLGDILSGKSNDTNADLIPDECNYGTCCENYKCSYGTLEDCPVGFSTKKCSDRRDCNKPIDFSDIGSCCVRTSSRGVEMKCVDSISRSECSLRRGSFSNVECSFRDCLTSVGSCCNSTGTNTCFNGVRASFCKSTFKEPIFDMSSCFGDSLCSITPTSVGSCMMNETCYDYVSKRECSTNQFAIFDFIPCDYRSDSVKPRIGSCCKKNGECQDSVGDLFCSSIGGAFSSGKCYENGWCDTRKSGSCCFDGQSCFRNEKAECLFYGKNMTEIECKTEENCLAVQDMRRGCCYFNDQCLVDVMFSQCQLFGGEYAEHSVCESDKTCEDGFNVSKLIKRETINVEENVIIENIQSAEKMNAQQIVPTTIFSVIIGIIIIVGVGFTIALIYLDKKKDKNKKFPV